MSVYTELIRIGMKEDEAGQIVESLSYNSNLATKQDILIAIKELEANLAWRITTTLVTTLLGATAIFSAVVVIIFNLSKLK